MTQATASQAELSVRLRRDAKVGLASDRLVIAVPEGSYEFRPTSSSAIREWDLLLTKLASEGERVSTLEAMADDPYRARLIEQLYKASLLIFTSPNPHCALGSHSRLKAAIASCSAQAIQTSMYRYLSGDTVEQKVLAGYAIESHHITRQAYNSIFPALPGSGPNFLAALLRMIREEHGHDKLLEVGVAAFGLSKDVIGELIPLPYTAALTTRLEQAARSDRRLFAAMIYMFERDSPLDDKVSDLLEMHGAPKEFLNAKRTHDRINADGCHSEIGDELFASLGDIAPSVESQVGRDLWLLVNLFERYTRGLLAYYSNTTFPLARTPEVLHHHAEALLDGTTMRGLAKLASSSVTLSTQGFLLSAVAPMLGLLYGRCDPDHRASLAEAVVALARKPLLPLDETPAPSEVPVAALALRDCLFAMATRLPPATAMNAYALALRCLSAIPGADSKMGEAFDRASAMLETQSASDGVVSVAIIQLGELMQVLRTELQAAEVLGYMPFTSEGM